MLDHDTPWHTIANLFYRVLGAKWHLKIYFRYIVHSYWCIGSVNQGRRSLTISSDKVVLTAPTCLVTNFFTFHKTASKPSRHTATENNRLAICHSEKIKIPKCNQRHYIEGQTTQWSKEKKTNNDLHNTTQNNKDRVTRTLL